jgi:hypothetical protein
MFTIGVDERLLANTFHEVVPPVVRDEWYFVDKALRLKLARAYAARNAGLGDPCPTRSVLCCATLGKRGSG